MTNAAEELNAHDRANAEATNATRGVGGDATTDAVTELIDAARGVLGPVLAERPELARVVRALGRVLVEVAEGTDLSSLEGDALPEGPLASAPDDESCRPLSGATATTDSAPESALSVDMPVTLGGASLHVPVAYAPEDASHVTSILGAHRDRDQERATDAPLIEVDGSVTGAPIEAEPIDLDLVQTRCALKAQGCRAAARRSAYDSWETIDPVLKAEIGDIVARAKTLHRGFVWALYPGPESPPAPMLETIAQCYETVAHAAQMLGAIDDPALGATDADRSAAYQLAAESTSMLRAALEDTWVTEADCDQDDVYRWLLAETSVRQIYIVRYMKYHDLADPSRLDDVRAEMNDLLDTLAARRKKAKAIADDFGKIEYHLDKCTPSSDPFHDPDDNRDHAARIDHAITSLEAAGIPPSDPRYRAHFPSDTIAALRRDLGPDHSAATDRVFTALAQYWFDIEQADASADGADADHPAGNSASTSGATATSERATWSDQVHEVRTLLNGGRIVIVGGDPRPDAITLIKDAFATDDVDWVRTIEHGPSTPIITAINHPHTTLVLSLIRFTGHQHAEDTRTTARARDIPWVNVTGGYNPESIAHAVMGQVSGRLG